jgi:hypothetical protein
MLIPGRGGRMAVTSGINAGSTMVASTKPARDECCHRCRRGERAAQIVQHLPAPNRRHRARLAAAGIAPDDPRQQLPVPARPTVMALRGDVVARGKFLHHLDI